MDGARVAAAQNTPPIRTTYSGSTVVGPDGGRRPSRVSNRRPTREAVAPAAYSAAVTSGSSAQSRRAPRANTASSTVPRLIAATAEQDHPRQGVPPAGRGTDRVGVDPAQGRGLPHTAAASNARIRAGSTNGVELRIT